MTLLEQDLVKYITSIIVEICNHDKVCKANGNAQKIFNTVSKKRIEIDKISYDNLPDITKQLMSVAKKHNVKYNIIDTIAAIRKYLKTKNKDDFTKVLGLFSEIKKHLSKIISTKNGLNPTNIKNDYETLKKIVKNFNQNAAPPFDFVLTLSDMKELKEKNLKLYEKYITAFGYLNQQAKVFIQHLILSKGQQQLPITEISENMVSHNFPPLFHGQLDKNIYMDLNFNLTYNKTINLSCKLPFYRVKIQYNKSYNPETDDQYILKFKVLGGSTWQFCYSEKYKKRITKSKYEKVNSVIPKIDSVRKIWLKDMNNKNLEKAQYGLATEIIYHTGMRVGTKGNQTDGKPTYGLLTLPSKTVKCKNNSVIFDYIGKAGVRHVHTITEKNIVKLVCSLKKKRKDDEQLFSITPEQLNSYVRKRLKLPITIHKFRTIKGTKIAYEKLIKNNPCSKLKSEKEKMEYLKKTLLDIGKELGHFSGTKVTGETALKNYVDVSIIKQYFEKCNIKVTKKYQKLFSLVEQLSNIPDEYPAWPGVGENSKAAKTLTFYTKYF